MTALVLVDHHNGKILPATRAAITAASQLSSDIHLVLFGHAVDAVTKEAISITGVSKALVADAPVLAQPLAEVIAPALVSLAPSYSHILAPATTMGKDILPRAAALLGVAQVSDVIRIESADTFTHPIYAGNALETVKMLDTIKLLTIRATAFDKAGDGGNASISPITVEGQNTLSRFVSEQLSSSARPELTAARIVVSGGRGVGSKENFAIIEALADKLGAAVGASRAAVDAGYVPNDYQVGQTGKVVAPELYIAVGISGAIQHLAGMKESKVIVAINKDENAPIFDIADYGLVADLFDAVPQLTQSI
jgi:electron transfer flavoprotein alpha subunit